MTIEPVYLIIKVMAIDIKHLSKLANIPLLPDEESKLEAQLETTIEHVNRLSSVDTSNITGTNEVTDLENVTRPDATTPPLPQEKALQNAHHTHNGFFVVPAVLEGD